MNDCIEICDLIVEASIGAYEWEKQNLQKLHFDVEIFADTRLPGTTDQLEDAIDYTQVADQIRRVVKTRHFILVESLAEEIASAILENNTINKVSLRVTKPEAIHGSMAIAITITRSK